MINFLCNGEEAISGKHSRGWGINLQNSHDFQNSIIVHSLEPSIGAWVGWAGRVYIKACIYGAVDFVDEVVLTILLVLRKIYLTLHRSASVFFINFLFELIEISIQTVIFEALFSRNLAEILPYDSCILSCPFSHRISLILRSRMDSHAPGEGQVMTIQSRDSRPALLSSSWFWAFRAFWAFWSYFFQGCQTTGL